MRNAGESIPAFVICDKCLAGKTTLCGIFIFQQVQMLLSISTSSLADGRPGLRMKQIDIGDGLALEADHVGYDLVVDKVPV